MDFPTLLYDVTLKMQIVKIFDRTSMYRISKNIYRQEMSEIIIILLVVAKLLN